MAGTGLGNGSEGFHCARKPGENRFAGKHREFRPRYTKEAQSQPAQRAPQSAAGCITTLWWEGSWYKNKAYPAPTPD